MNSELLPALSEMFTAGIVAARRAYPALTARAIRLGYADKAGNLTRTGRALLGKK